MAVDATARRVRKVLVTFAHPDDAEFAVRSRRKKVLRHTPVSGAGGADHGLWATLFLTSILP